MLNTNKDLLQHRCSHSNGSRSNSIKNMQTTLAPYFSQHYKHANKAHNSIVTVTHTNWTPRSHSSFGQSRRLQL